MHYKNIAVLFLFLILLNIVVSEENTSSEDQNTTVENLTSNETNETAVIPEQQVEIEEILLKNFIPKEFKLGDAQFSIQVQNNKNETINNVVAFVSGKGFSTYEITSIESLEPGERGYILINGNFKESGLINLTIKINQKISLQEINVLGKSEEDLKKAEVLVKQEEEKKKALADISSKLEILKQNYSELEAQLAQKEKENYDVKSVSLVDLKKYIRETQASILGDHLEDARVNFGLATEESNALEEKIASLKKVSFIKRFKDQVIIFSSIAGAIITLFALYELLKRKGKEAATSAATTMGSIKQKVEKKEEPKVEQQEMTEEPKKEKEEEKTEKKEEEKDKGKKEKRRKKHK